MGLDSPALLAFVPVHLVDPGPVFVVHRYGSYCGHACEGPGACRRIILRYMVNRLLRRGTVHLDLQRGKGTVA